MPPPQYASPFPQLHLSIDEREMLIRTANDLVSQGQEKYEWFLWQDRQHLDSDRWQFVRTQDDMTVYVDRQLANNKDNRNMQLLLATGTVPGTLHDAMYGVLNPSSADIKVKTAYIQDTLLDGAVLETILEPTVDQPFHSLSLRWFVKGMPLHVRAMARKHGDNVSIEATGTRQLYNGEQVGYHIMQSVMLAETPPLPQYERCKLSTCTFWRQMTPQLVQAYMTCYVEIPESFMIPLQIKSIAGAFVAQSKIAHCAKMKKLTWLIGQKASKKELDARGSTNSAGKGNCWICASKCPSSAPCAVCVKSTCLKCREKHDLFTVGADRELIKTKVRVCQPCMKTVGELDSGVVAQHDVIEREQNDGLKQVFRRDMRTSTASSMASSVSSESGMF